MAEDWPGWKLTADGLAPHVDGDTALDSYPRHEPAAAALKKIQR